VVPAVTATGVAKLACCQPLEVSPVKFTVARRVPAVVHRLPVWAPVLPAGL